MNTSQSGGKDEGKQFKDRLTTLLSIYDFYIGVPLTDVNFYLLFILITIITMFVVIYLKFFKK